MKYVKLLASLVFGGLALVACSVIPPVPIPQNAVGYTSTEVTVGTPPVAGSLAVFDGGTADPIEFDNITPPDLPIAPSTFKSVQGFDGTVSVTGTALPETLTINSGTLTVTVADLSADAPAPVTASADFGPFSLSRVGTCTTLCDYTFDDPDAAAQSLVLTLNGKGMSRLIEIITEHDSNTVDVALEVDVADDPTSLTFTIEVVENVIGF